MKVAIEGIGLWGGGLTSWGDFSRVIESDIAPANHAGQAPAPVSIPARERRRAPLSVKLAIEVIDQAASMAGIDQSELCSVFSSAIGDSNITDYICSSLAMPKKMLSPTKFHNSVHNAPSGYWSIGAANRRPSTFVSAYALSFPAALLESCVLANVEQRPAVLAIYDVAFGAPLSDLYPYTEDFAAAFIINPHPDSNSFRVLDVNVASSSESGPTTNNEFVAARLRNNASAAALLLAELLLGKENTAVTWPLSASLAEPGSALEMTMLSSSAAETR